MVRMPYHALRSSIAGAGQMLIFQQVDAICANERKRTNPENTHLPLEPFQNNGVS
jgi:hypothetical protein